LGWGAAPRTPLQRICGSAPHPQPLRASFARLDPTTRVARGRRGVDCAHLRDLAARSARGLPKISLTLSTERAQGMPGARCADSRVCNECERRTRVRQVTPVSPGIPRAMVLTASFVISPATGCFATVASRITPRNLTPAPGRQDHTTSPSASGAVVTSAIGVHRIPPRVRDVAQRPS